MAEKLAINWHPPATIYMFEADWYCPDCAKAIERDLIGEGFALCQGMADSDCWPVTYSSGAGESDSPDHCGDPQCSRFLGRNLTDDGVQYVKDQAAEELGRDGGIGEVVQGWLDYYAIELEECLSPISEQEFLATEFEFEYCEECHGDQQDHRAICELCRTWEFHLEHRWSVACSAEQDWQRCKRWTHPCRITGCSDHPGPMNTAHITRR